MKGRSLTYPAYLELETLLSLQRPRSAPVEHDEMLFIVVHQVYELWFRQLLHELDALCVGLVAGDHTCAFRTLRRLCTILKTLVGQVDVLETMSPTSFRSFRTRLEAASGMESSQFREIELACGHKQKAHVTRIEDPTTRERLERRLEQPSVYDAFLRYLVRRGQAVPCALLERNVSEPIEPSEALQAVLLDVYRRDPGTAQICELLVDLDEGFQEWRYRHVKMVERTIGNRRGTGGSAGVEYLRGTLFKPFFPDLWAIRDQL